jgi:glucose/arabinose dehydrogenase
LSRGGIRGRGALPGLTLLALAAACAAARPSEKAHALPVIPVPAEVARGVRLVEVATGLDRPLGMAFAPNDPAKRLFVAEKTGKIRVLANGRLVAEPFLDLSSRVSRGSEQGLLGLAFHPDYTKNGRLFVNYTDRDGDTRVVEIAVTDPAASSATIARERELLHVKQPYSNHNGGNLVVAPDGALLIGLGDGGSGGDPHGNSQNPGSLLGKMLRLDPDAPGDPHATILAKGLRNPWRYAIDHASGDLYIADVGQDAWEEVDVVPLATLVGKNFGWNVMEGAHCFKSPACSTEGYVLPVVEYGHDSGCSITGGVVYRGKALPALAGLYFYSDYCTGILRSFRWDGRDATVTDHWDWKRALDPANRLSQIAAFGEDADGEVYVISLDGTLREFRGQQPN